MSSKSVNSKDPRVKEIKKHLKILSRRHEGAISTKDYLEYRSKHAPSLPSTATLYRLFGSWNNALVESNINEQKELSRFSDESLIESLQKAAKDLDVEIMSTHTYDKWRSEQPEPLPPSSSVIRKWMKTWANAVERAGLKSTDRSVSRSPSVSEVIEAIRNAKSNTTGMLDQQKYIDYLETLKNPEKDKYPDMIGILKVFPSWELALRAADVEQADVIHPTGMWTADEVRKIVKKSEMVLGEPLNENNYKKITSASRTPKPSWKVIKDLLKL